MLCKVYFKDTLILLADFCTHPVITINLIIDQIQVYVY